jgi:hypothetical protein
MPGSAEQARAVAGIDTQIAQIDASVGKSTERGSAHAALAVTDQQRKTRDGLVAARAQAADALVGLRVERARLYGERRASRLQRRGCATSPPWRARRPRPQCAG